MGCAASKSLPSNSTKEGIEEVEAITSVDFEQVAHGSESVVPVVNENLQGTTKTMLSNSEAVAISSDEAPTRTEVPVAHAVVIAGTQPLEEGNVNSVQTAVDAVSEQSEPVCIDSNAVESEKTAVIDKRISPSSDVAPSISVKELTAEQQDGTKPMAEEELIIGELYVIKSIDGCSLKEFNVGEVVRLVIKDAQVQGCSLAICKQDCSTHVENIDFLGCGYCNVENLSKSFPVLLEETESPQDEEEEGFLSLLCCAAR